MTFEEMREAIEVVLEERQVQREERSLVVAIGHSKDFVDSEAIRRFLDFLQERSIRGNDFLAPALSGATTLILRSAMQHVSNCVCAPVVPHCTIRAEPIKIEWDPSLPVFAKEEFLERGGRRVRLAGGDR